MKKQKRSAAISSILIVLLLFLSSCAPGGRGGEQPQYRKGSQGLDLRFVPNLPPAQIYDDQPFTVLLEVRNIGAKEVGVAGDRVYLSGFDPDIVTGISQYGEPIPMNLEGISVYNTEGGYDTMEFSGTITHLASRNIDVYPITLLATACYNYETIASENVCIDPNPYSQSAEEKVCQPKAVSFGTQGAPIAVSNVEVDAVPGKTRFKIYINNVGGGTVYKSGADHVTRCSPYHGTGLQYEDVDYVKLNSVSVAGKSITHTCKPVKSEHIRLSNGQGFIICELGGMSQGPAFTSPLTVELAYGYRDSVSKQVQILQTQ